MATKTIDFLDLGRPGLVLDKPAYALAPNELSLARNVRLSEGQIRSFPGHIKICEGDLEVFAPYFIQALPLDEEYFWIVAGLDDQAATDLCLSDGLTKTDVAPAGGIVITPSDQWSGGIFGGVSVISNGRTNPPYYLADAGGPAPQYEDLPYDITPGAPPVVTSTWRDEAVTAQVIRPFKNFLVAFDITRSNDRYPYLVKWSDAADAGLIPAWDHTDPTLLAGEYPLPEAGGFIVDFLPLGDLGMIYKEGSIWSMSLVGSSFVFNFRRAINSIGALATNCVAEFRGQHLVLGDGDIVIHNGQTTQSVVEEKIKKHLFRTMDTDNYRASFVVRNDKSSEVWVCYPTTGCILPNQAAVWNWKDNSWTIRDLPECTATMIRAVDITGQVLPTEDPWGCLIEDPPDCTAEFVVSPQAWGGTGVPFTPQIWSERAFNPVVKTMVSVGETGIFKMDTGLLYNGSPATCIAERTGVPLSGHDRRCKVRRVYPLIDSTGPVDIYIGSQAYPTAPISWEGPRSFDPDSQSFINVRRSGKLVSWRVESRAEIEWSLHGFRWDYTEEGRA